MILCAKDRTVGARDERFGFRTWSLHVTLHAAALSDPGVMPWG